MCTSFSANHDVRCDERRTVIEENKKIHILLVSEWCVHCAYIYRYRGKTKSIEIPWNPHQHRGLFAAPTPNTHNRNKIVHFHMFAFISSLLFKRTQIIMMKRKKTHEFLYWRILSALHWHMGGFWCALRTQFSFLFAAFAPNLDEEINKAKRKKRRTHSNIQAEDKMGKMHSLCRLNLEGK